MGDDQRCKLRLTVETAMMGGATMIGDLKCIWIMSAYCTKISDGGERDISVVDLMPRGRIGGTFEC